MAQNGEEAGRREFRKYAEPAAFMERRHNHRLVTAEENETLAGVIEIREFRHISLLFVAREYQGRGIAKALFHRALNMIRQDNPECTTITVNSAPDAVGFYRKLGFRAASDEQCVNGIRFTPMRKLLFTAYCGLYCEQCSFRTAHEENNPEHLAHLPFPFALKDLSEYACGGCKSGRCICGKCRIKPCAMAREIDDCSECPEFPCPLIEEFANDGLPHHRDAVENLHQIREHGFEGWYESIQSALQCPCGRKQTWYWRCPLHD